MKNRKLIITILILGIVVIGVIVGVIIYTNKKDDPKDNVSVDTNPPSVQKDDAGITEIPSDKLDGVTKTPTGVEIVEKSDNEVKQDTTPQPTTTPTEEEIAYKEFDVYVEMGEYKGLKVVYEKKVISNSDVEKLLDDFCKKNTYQEQIVDRALKEGDIAIVNYEGYLDGELYESLVGVCSSFLLGSGQSIPGFEESIEGHKIGDIFEKEITYPDDYYLDPTLSGKIVLFKFEIVDGFEMVVPVLTDEVIQSMSDFKNLAEYKSHVKEQMQKEADIESEKNLEKNLIMQIIDNSSFTGNINDEIEYIINKTIENNDQEAQAHYFNDGADYENQVNGVTYEDYMSKIRADAEFTAKRNHILDEIAVKENISISEDDYNEKLKEIFIDTYGLQSVEEVYATVPENVIKKTVDNEVLRDKAMAYVVSNAEIDGR